ncbi:MAG: Crp/Fnr family transcriptional regulator [Rhodanobacteraceae bacterium]
MTQTDLPAANRLISGLPDAEREGLLALCERVQVPLGKTIVEAGQRLSHAWFPVDSFFSLVTQVDEEADLEVGLSGPEGMIGAGLVLGIMECPQRALVQGAGDALVIEAAQLHNEMERSLALRRRLAAYVYVLMVQFSQAAVCIHGHLLEKRLARWLLMSSDRAGLDDFQVTHDFLAYMLGVRRSGVTEAARILQSLGLIKYRYGKVHILDRAGLEAMSCPCYGIDKTTYRRVLGTS